MHAVRAPYTFNFAMMIGKNRAREKAKKCIVLYSVGINGEKGYEAKSFDRMICVIRM